MDWSLCIATLNRRDALLRTLRHALAQTRPPREVVVVDVSDDWEETARIVRADLFAARPEIRLVYETCKVRSLTVQRNQAIAHCTSDVLFLLDDDSFMFSDCAQEVMRIYEADSGHEVAGIGLALDSALPDLPDARAADIERKVSGEYSTAGLQERVMRHAWGRWVNRKILLQSPDELFIKYEGPRALEVPVALGGFDVTPATFMQGCTMTVRREVALREPFDEALRYYAATEDLDATYRFGRHGVLLHANRARMHHFEAAGGRMKRKKVIIFQLLNGAYLLRRNAAEPDRFKTAYRILTWRRLLGEVLKDGLARRFDFPQVRGVLAGMKLWPQVWQHDRRDLTNWYPEFQKKVLEEL